jgi:hypothetical protein
MTMSSLPASGDAQAANAHPERACSICAAGSRAERTVLDQAMQRLLAGEVPRSTGQGLRGACRRHGLSSSWDGDALAGLIKLYASVLGSVLNELQLADRRSFIGPVLGDVSPVPRRTRPGCEACRVRDDAERSAVSELITELRGGQTAGRDGVTAPICLPHIAAALDRADDRVGDILRSRAARTVERALGSLASISQPSVGFPPVDDLLSELETVQTVQALLMGSDLAT